MSGQNLKSFLNRFKIYSTLWIIFHLLLILGIIGFIVFRPTALMWNYQPIDGVIIQSDMESCGGAGDGYYPVVKFSYSIGDRTYLNGDLRRDFARMCHSKQDAVELLKQYPVGTPVDGWYDPDKPRIAVIDRSLGAIQWGFLLVAGGFAAILSFAAFSVRRNQRRVNLSKTQIKQQGSSEI